MGVLELVIETEIIYEGYGEFFEARVPMTVRRRLVPAWRTSSDRTRRGAVPICLTRFVDSMGSGWRCDVQSGADTVHAVE